jgi:ABC-type Na+ efflux pump permease subunit
LSASHLQHTQDTEKVSPSFKAHSFKWESIFALFALLVFGYILLHSLWIYVNSQTVLPSSTVSIPLQVDDEHSEAKKEANDSLHSSLNDVQNNKASSPKTLPAVNEHLNQEIKKIVKDSQTVEDKPAFGIKQMEKTALVKASGSVSTPVHAAKAVQENNKKQQDKTLILEPENVVKTVVKEKTKNTIKNKRSVQSGNKKQKKAIPKNTVNKTTTSTPKKLIKNKQPKRSGKQKKENDFQLLEQSLGL